MKKPRIHGRCSRLVASLHGECLFLAPDLRRRVVAEMLQRINRLDAESEAGLSVWGKGLSNDLRAFARSVTLERLADLHLCLGSRVAAFRALRDAALSALCGEEYDHGEESLPLRFLRIRFYHLFERMLACRDADPHLQELEIDSFLAREARRLGGETL